MSQHLWWEQLQDEAEARVDMPRLPITTSIQILKQHCYCGKDANKSPLEQQTCLLQVYMITLKWWIIRENEVACATEGTMTSGTQLTLTSQRIC